MYISIDGLDFCGKSTHIESIKKILIENGIAEENILVVAEPGNVGPSGAIGDLLRDNEKLKGVCPESELLLFMAARYQVINTLVNPFKDKMSKASISPKDYAIITDRSYISSYAYQSNKSPMTSHIYEYFHGKLLISDLPNIAVVLTADLETIKQRSSQVKTDRLESVDDDVLLGRHNMFMNMLWKLENHPRVTPVHLVTDGSIDVVRDNMSDLLTVAISDYRQTIFVN